MTLRDFAQLSVGNLFRMKLRAFLTISGVVIAIGAFVAMVSFGAGNQERIQDEFRNLGLLGTMVVYPPDDDDSTQAELNQEAIQKLSHLKGVNLIYPYSRFSTQVALADTQFSSQAQALPTAAFETALFSQFAAGGGFRNGGVNQVILNRRLVTDLGIEHPDFLIGDSLIVSVDIASIDTAIAFAMRDLFESIGDRANRTTFDSLTDQDYVIQVLRDEMSGTVAQFMEGFLDERVTISDTLEIVGVLSQREVGYRVRPSPLVISMSTAQKFDTAGFSGDMTSLVSAMRSGAIFGGATADRTGFDRVTIDFDPAHPYDSLKDTIEAMGFRTFSYAEEFDEIRRFFLYFNMALGLIGLIALTTASLGIINTMVMSILERRREIGIMKSLGADEREIRLLFLAESAAIGSIGAIVGIVLGWLISRAASAIAKAFMRNEGIDPIELFALPWWLILIAFGLGFVVSVVAGYYPASRAARVDPVEALRNE